MRPQHLMLFPWENCSFSTLKRPASRMAGLLWAEDNIVSRIVPLQHTTLLLGFHGQGSSSWPQQHRGGRSLMNMCFILSSFIAERAALQLQNPATLPYSYHGPLFHSVGHRSDLCMLCSVCTQRDPCPKDRFVCPHPTSPHTFLVRWTSELGLEHFLWKRNQLWLLRHALRCHSWTGNLLTFLKEIPSWK